MPLDGWITLGIVGLVLATLIVTRRAADMVLLAGLTLALVVPVPDGAAGSGWKVGVIDPADAFIGLANPGVIAIGALFVVVAGLRQTGGVEWITRRLLGRPRHPLTARLRMVGPVAVLSAFLNNTPVVAMMIPAVSDWARKLSISPSRLLMPLSFAAILGGLCTLIGTSTNLVVNGLLIQSFGPEAGLSMFEIGYIGLPVAVVGLGYLLVAGALLPERRPAIRALLDDPRQYTVEMLVEAGSPLVGRTIEQAGLRHLPGMYLVEIDRGGTLLAAVGPETELHAGDRLVFVGVVESVKDLQKIRGLVPATDQVFKLDRPRHERCLVEAVVSNTCPLLGKTIRAGRFRTVYDAAVIAVARNGVRVAGKVGDITLKPGDTLLLETHPNFVERMANRRDFFLVSEVADSAPLRHHRAMTALLILVAMVAAVAGGLLEMMTAALLAAGLMLASRCLTGADARRAIDWSVLLVIAAAFGLGRALETSGAAEAIAAALLAAAGDRPWVLLALVYLATALFTELITNNAAAVLLFPIALAGAADLGVDPMPFAIVIMVAASASFLSPLGYQTNLMVYGPGGYRFTDYPRFGLPLAAIVAAITLLLVPRIWPF